MNANSITGFSNINFGAKLPTKGVLEIVTGKHLSNEAWFEMGDILKKMSGDDVFTGSIPDVAKNCRKTLFKKCPKLNIYALKAKLFFMLPSNKNSISAEKWLNKQVAKLGDTIKMSI